MHSKIKLDTDLRLYALNLHILCINFVAHVKCHASQIAEDAAHMGQVLLHLILPCIICHSGNKIKSLMADLQLIIARDVCCVSF